ncbi:hypothetical protein QFZ40_000741 [Arthrobacter pascens]|nr:hypothetical protein [Arthrobacter pascens]
MSPATVAVRGAAQHIVVGDGHIILCLPGSGERRQL